MIFKDSIFDENVQMKCECYIMHITKQWEKKKKNKEEERKKKKKKERRGRGRRTEEENKPEE